MPNKPNGIRNKRVYIYVFTEEERILRSTNHGILSFLYLSDIITVAIIDMGILVKSEKIKIPVRKYEDFWWGMVDSDHRSQ